MPHPRHPTEPGLALVSAIPEICLPGEGMLCLDRAAFADVAPLRRLQAGSDSQNGQWPVGTSGDIGRHWSTLGSVGWRGLYPICTGALT